MPTLPTVGVVMLEGLKKICYVWTVVGMVCTSSEYGTETVSACLRKKYLKIVKGRISCTLLVKLVVVVRMDNKLVGRLEIV